MKINCHLNFAQIASPPQDVCCFSHYISNFNHVISVLVHLASWLSFSTRNLWRLLEWTFITDSFKALNALV